MKKWIISILAFASIIGFMTAKADVAKADNSTTVIEQMIDSNGFGFSVRSDRQQTHSDTSVLNINEFWARDVCVCEYYALNAPLAYPTHLAFPMYYITPPIKEDADIISYGARHLVTKIADQGFENCDYISGITIPNVSIPKGVNSIGEGAFVACVSLASMTIPEGVTCIGSDTFTECESLTDITIPSTLTSIGEEAFWDSGLTSIKVEPGNTKYDSRDNCNAIIDKESNTLLKVCNNTSVSIPNSVIDIGGLAFAFCTSLKSTTIPSTVTMIRIIITVKVSPKKQKVKSAKPAKGKKLTVKWTKDKNASGYQVQISTSKSFKKIAKVMNMKKYSKTSSTFKKLKAGKKYYVRARSYKRTGKSALYGAWSTPKQSKKIKK